MAEGATKSVCIVGAGISGLATAWFLHRRGVAVQVLEAAGRPGGTIGSVREDGWLVETGPNSTLRRPGKDDALGRLVAEIGFGERLIAADPAGAKRFVVRGGRLIPLPTTPPAFVATPLFSTAAKLRLLAEPFIGRARHEESIAAFVRRRLGAEFLDYAIEPFISGVYAGNPEALSVRAAVARIHAIETQYRSLILGAIALGRIAKQAGTPRGTIVSFAGGMAEFANGLAGRLPAGCVRTGHRVDALRPRPGGGWEIDWRTNDGNGTAVADAVVVATPAPAAADLVAPLSESAAESLRAIPYAPVASVALGFRRDAVTHPLDGFGFLVPRREGLRILGALFSSSLFPGRAPRDHVLLTAFIGGTTDPQAVDLDDAALQARVAADVGAVVGLRGDPVFARVTRWMQAIPQYTLGHLDRVAAVDRALAGQPGLVCRANWRDGIAVSDCVRNAEACAGRIAGPESGLPF